MQKIIKSIILFSFFIQDMIFIFVAEDYEINYV